MSLTMIYILYKDIVYILLKDVMYNILKNTKYLKLLYLISNSIYNGIMFEDSNVCSVVYTEETFDTCRRFNLFIHFTLQGYLFRWALRVARWRANNAANADGTGNVRRANILHNNNIINPEIINNDNIISNAWFNINYAVTNADALCEGLLLCGTVISLITIGGTSYYLYNYYISQSINMNNINNMNNSTMESVAELLQDNS